MGFEVSRSSRMLEVKCHDSSLKSLGSKEVFPRHKRCKSYPDERGKGDELGISPRALHSPKMGSRQIENNVDSKKKQSPANKLQNSLKQEILQLERRLQDQFAVRQALEKALGYRSSSLYTSNGNSMPKPTKELIREIAMLELEVTYLEQYLLSLYRKAFDQQMSALSPCNLDERLRSPSIPKAGLFLAVDELDSISMRENPGVQSGRPLFPQTPIVNSKKETDDIGSGDTLIDKGVHRSHSSLSQRSAHTTGTSPPMEKLAIAMRACHSQPLSMLEHTDSGTLSVISLAEHLGTRISDHVPETPNRLSEDVIRCMATIYCKLSEPPLMHHGLPSSPSSSLSSASEFSPQDRSDMWSPHWRKDSSFDLQPENPLQVGGIREFSGPYSGLVEVPWICRSTQRLNNIEDMLKNFRSLVQRLENVDARKMKNEEKLAFWINIHNALVMHAYLVYGIPQNSIKRGSILLKAAYNVGGQTLTADTIQSSILGCRTQRPGQWLRNIFSPRMKFKGGDRQSYAIEQPEPLLHFALCAGSFSDPVVRVYTAKRVFQELEAAKDDYIQATIVINKEQKILLPKIIESFAKTKNFSSVHLVDMIQHYLPEALQKNMQQSQQGKSRKTVDWAPHNFTFRYLLSKELMK